MFTFMSSTADIVSAVPSPWRSQSPSATIYDSENQNDDSDSEDSNEYWQTKAEAFENRLQAGLQLDDRTGSLVSLESIPRAGAQRLGRLVASEWIKQQASVEEEGDDCSICSWDSFLGEPKKNRDPTFIKVPKVTHLTPKSWDQLLTSAAESEVTGNEHLDPLDMADPLEGETLDGAILDPIETPREFNEQEKEVEEEKEENPLPTFQIDSTDEIGNTEATLSEIPEVSNEALSDPPARAQPEIQKKKWRFFVGGRKGPVRESERKKADSDNEEVSEEEVVIRFTEFEPEIIEEYAEPTRPPPAPMAYSYTPVDEPEGKNYCGKDFCGGSLVSFH